MKSRSKPDFVGLANQRLISTLTRNLANMQHFSRRDAVSFLRVNRPDWTIRREVNCVCAPQLEKLTLVVEQLRGSGVATRATFLVLTRTLLLSLGDLNETEHLLTCQRVYMLLEPPLLEVIRNDSEPVHPIKKHIE